MELNVRADTHIPAIYAFTSVYKYTYDHISQMSQYELQ